MTRAATPPLVEEEDESTNAQLEPIPVQNETPCESRQASPVLNETPREATPVQNETPCEPREATPVQNETPCEPRQASPVRDEPPCEPRQASPVRDELPCEPREPRDGSTTPDDTPREQPEQCGMQSEYVTGHKSVHARAMHHLRCVRQGTLDSSITQTMQNLASGSDALPMTYRGIVDYVATIDAQQLEQHAMDLFSRHNRNRKVRQRVLDVLMAQFLRRCNECGISSKRLQENLYKSSQNRACFRRYASRSEQLLQYQPYLFAALDTRFIRNTTDQDWHAYMDEVHRLD